MSVIELPRQGAGDKAGARPARVTTTKFKAMKERGEKIVMLTAYDYSTARIADAAGIHASHYHQDRRDADDGIVGDSA